MVAATNCSNDSPPDTRLRNTSVFTNIPITESNSASPRPATGVPTTMSSVPDNRANNTASAACTTMNNVAFCDRATRTKPRCVTEETGNTTRPPANDATAGRARSAGRFNSSGTPANTVCQNRA
ncbi:hypothetical protein NRB56_76670 [Nocardia sp. RB56]|uniref:Uncharacterized protein n=1 Tax=Nocardia aurantia TaxID=2585199 RepID=A0A7K0E1T2_9NOCA|nr:hypothetical protein [Nocardia aurantia]